MLHQLRLTARQLAKSPLFAAVTILTLALGIGANTAIFSVAYALLLRPPAYPEPDRIMVLMEARLPQFPTYPVSGANYLDWQTHLKSFAKIGGTQNIFLNYSGGTQPQRLSAQRAALDYFEVFATPPLRGRIFTAEEDVHGGKVTVLSYGLWQSLFGGDAQALGRTLLLDGAAYTVIGVMPPEFQQGSGVQLWVPMALTDPEKSNERRGAHFLEVFGRLKPGVTPAQALEELEVFNHSLQLQYPDSNKSCSALLLPLADHYNKEVRPVLLVLLGTVACVLLIACLNVANLLLARGAARSQEIAVRAALGASRGRLMGQILSESLLLSLAGGLLGVVLAYALLATLVRIIPANLPQAHLISVNGPVLAFSVALSLLTGLVFGLLPAWRVTRVDLGQVTRDGSRGNTGGARSRLQAALVAFEVAASVILLVGTALLGRSFAQLQKVDKGFQSEHALMLNVTLPLHKYGQPPQQVAFARDFLGRLASLPGVTSVGLTHRMPLVRDAVLRLIVQGRPPVAIGDLPNTNYYAVTPDYLRAMGIPLLRGRGFSERDNETAPRVALINETFARNFFPGEDPIGQRIIITNGNEDWREVIGIVRDVKSAGIDHEVIPQSYEPFYQQPTNTLWFVLRFQGDPGALPAAVRQKLTEIDRDQSIAQMRLVDEVVADSVARPRFAMTLVSGFSLIALLIASVGIYGLMSYRVVQQTREIGIRLALGATPANVLAQILREGLGIIGLGLLAGAGASLAFARLIQGLLFETDPRDPVALAAVSAILALIGLLACWLPARRAARVDPMIALRAE